MSLSLAGHRGGFFKFLTQKIHEALAKSAGYLFFRRKTEPKATINDRYDHVTIQKDLVDLIFPTEGIRLQGPKEQILIALSKHFKIDL
jgi:hypothetical protein